MSIIVIHVTPTCSDARGHNVLVELCRLCGGHGEMGVVLWGEGRWGEGRCVGGEM
jgi:hypothetical protein